MEAFWCITLSIIAIRAYLKHSRDSTLGQESEPVSEPPPVVYRDTFATYDKEDKSNRQAEKARLEIERQREKEIVELKKKGYSDELIAVILPTINNGQ